VCDKRVGRRTGASRVGREGGTTGGSAPWPERLNSEPTSTRPVPAHSCSIRAAFAQTCPGETTAGPGGELGSPRPPDQRNRDDRLAAGRQRQSAGCSVSSRPLPGQDNPAEGQRNKRWVLRAAQVQAGCVLGEIQEDEPRGSGWGGLTSRMTPRTRMFFCDWRPLRWLGLATLGICSRLRPGLRP